MSVPVLNKLPGFTFNYQNDEIQYHFKHLINEYIFIIVLQIFQQQKILYLL